MQCPQFQARGKRLVGRSDDSLISDEVFRMPGPLSRPKSSFSNSVIALSIVIADNRGSYRGSLMNPEEGESNRVLNE